MLLLILQLKLRLRSNLKTEHLILDNCDNIIENP